MKYKPNEKFIISINSVMADTCSYMVGNNEEWFFCCGDKTLDRLERYNPLSLVWIDGAKNPPIFGEKVVIRPNNNKGCYHWKIVSTNEKRDWAVLYWIYLDSFPMPEDPI